MSDAMMWFGNANYAQWVPAPDSGMGRSRVGSAEQHESDAGGMVGVRSVAHHNVFDMQWSSLNSHGLNSLNTFTDYSTNVYGPGFLYFVDPMIRKQNLMSAPWGSPGLCERDWKPIVEGKVSYMDTPIKLPGYPLRTMVAEESVYGGNSDLENTQFTILVPPGYRLKIAVLGGSILPADEGPSLYCETSQNLTGVFLVGRTIGVTPLGAPLQFYDASGTTDLFSQGAVVRMSLSMYQGSYITGIMAQLVRPGEVVGAGSVAGLGGLTAFIPGRGFSGCMFIDGDATPETYILGNDDRAISSLSSRLGEVEQWTRRSALT